MSFEPSLVRQGLDWLLEHFPHLDVVKVEWQTEDGHWTGPWVLVEMGQPSLGGIAAWAVWKFAIWRETGAVYQMHDGAVSDDPDFVP